MKKWDEVIGQIQERGGTLKEISEFAGVSLSMLKKYKSGASQPSWAVGDKLLELNSNMMRRK